MRPLSSKPNVTPPSSAYPYARLKDDTGTNNGVPVDEQVYGDFHQFFERLMIEGGITPNGSPENATDGFQLNEALFNLAVKPSLSFNGNFNDQSPVDDIQYSSPQSMGDMASNDDTVFIAGYSGSNYTVDKYSLRNKTLQGFIFSTDNIANVAIDETHCWIFVDAFTKSIKAYDINTGIEDLTRTISLSSASYTGLKVKGGIVYIGDNTANEIKLFNSITGAAFPSIGVSLNNITDFDVDDRFLYMINSIDYVVTVFDRILGGVLWTFPVISTQPLLSIKTFANRIFILKGDVSTTTISIFDKNTFDLRQQESFFVQSGGIRKITIGGNLLMKMHQTSVNRIDLIAQKIDY